MYKIKLEHLNRDTLSEMFPLIDESKDEVYALNNLKNDMEVNDVDDSSMDFNYYLYLQYEDSLKMFTIRYNNELVGYIVFIISEHIQNKNFKTANANHIHININHRSYQNFSNLLKTSEDYLFNFLKVDRVSFGIPYHHKTKEKLFKRKGYKSSEIILTKDRCE